MSLWCKLTVILEWVIILEIPLSVTPSFPLHTDWNKLFSWIKNSNVSTDFCLILSLLHQQAEFNQVFCNTFSMHYGHTTPQQFLSSTRAQKAKSQHCFLSVTLPLPTTPEWVQPKLLCNLTLVLLNPDISCICKQCRSRSVGFWRTDLNLHCLPLSLWIYSNNPNQSHWLKIRCGRGNLIYSAWQGLIPCASW